jgi:hypothetical protein
MLCTAVGSCMKSILFSLFFWGGLYIRVLCYAIYGPYVVVGFMAVCTEGVQILVLTAINNLKTRWSREAFLKNVLHVWNGR